MSMFKKALTFIIVAELAICAYLLFSYKTKAKTVQVKVAPSDTSCADYLYRENMAWLKSFEKTKRNGGND